MPAVSVPLTAAGPIVLLTAFPKIISPPLTVKSPLTVKLLRPAVKFEVASRTSALLARAVPGVTFR